ncbi:MAG: GGDEF domain-containing protein [Coprobacillus sp.]
MKSPLMRKSIIITILSLVVFASAATIYIQILSQNIYNETDSYLNKIAIQTSDAINSRIQENLTQLKTISLLIEENKMTNDNIFEYLHDLAIKVNNKRFGIIDMNGNAKTSDGKSFNASEREYFQQSILGKNAISNVLRDVVDNQEINVLSVPIYNKEQKVVSVLFSTFSTNKFAEILNNASFNSGGYSFIFNEHGKTIIFSNDTPTDNNVTQIQDINTNQDFNIKSIDTKGSGVIQFTDQKGNKNYLTYANIKSNDWLVASIFPKEYVTQEINGFIQTAYITWLIVGVGSALLITAVYVLQKKRKMEITKLAYEDPLTHHYNFNKFIEEAKNKKHLSQYLLISCDMKEYKWFAEIYGEDTAHDLLITIIESMKDFCQNHELYCRESSDIFALLLKKEEVENIKDRLMSLTKMIRENFMHKHQTTTYYFHFGIYSIEDNHMDIRNAFHKTNYAKVGLKELSKDDIVYYQEQQYQEELEAKQIEEEFNDALLNEQFKVYIQPKTNVYDESVSSGEILTRWIHPNKGLIPPYRFIPLFERNGSLEQLDIYILEKSLQVIKRWKDLYHKEISISVNASKTYLFNIGYVDKLVDLVKKYDINPHSIQVEITEETAVKRKSELIIVLNYLKKNGIKIALDDFGSGYSSLNMLKDFPIDVVKIDQEFFKTNIHNQEKSNIIIKEVIELCHQLGIDVVAEGVETKEQRDFLKQYYCDYIQGFYYYKPMPIQEFEEKFVKDKSF